MKPGPPIYLVCEGSIYCRCVAERAFAELGPPPKVAIAEEHEGPIPKNAKKGKFGCKCRRCLKLNARYMREYRARKQGEN